MALTGNHRRNEELLVILTGTILLLLADAQNLTFDTFAGENKYEEFEIGVNMHGCFHCKAPGQPCLMPELMLSKFAHFGTLMSSKPPNLRPYELHSLAVPLDKSIICTLLATVLSTTLRVIICYGNWTNVSGAMLAACAPLISQSSETNDDQTRIPRSLYGVWIVFATWMPFIYTNELQSTIVVPEVRTSELSFIDLVHRNYTLFSTAAGAIKKGASFHDE